MSSSKQHLSPVVLEFCRQCSPADGQSIVAYACHLAFADKTLRRMEVEVVRAIGEQIGVSQEAIASMARKVRKGRLKIKRPTTSAARSLLFHLAVQLAIADDIFDPAERKAIDKLAVQLELPEETVERELAEAEARLNSQSQAGDPSVAKPPPVPRKPQPPKPPPKPNPPMPKPVTSSPAEQPALQGFFGGLFEIVTQNWVVHEFEADLYPPGQPPMGRKHGEVEYTLTRGGQVEFEVEIKTPLPLQGVPISVNIGGRLVCEIRYVGQQIDTTVHDRDHAIIPPVAAGDSVEIVQDGNTVLIGQFQIS